MKAEEAGLGNGLPKRRKIARLQRRRATLAALIPLILFS
jgi:hypothetical protein